MQGFVVILMALASAVVSAAGSGLNGRDFGGVLAPFVKDIGARQVYDANGAPIVARDKETVTVTVTADCTTGTAETPAVTGVSVSTGPVVIVPGTQSETGTFSIPAGGATITPGVTSNVPVPSTAEVSTPGATPSSGAPVPGSVTSATTSVSSAPVTSSGTTTTAVTTKSSTSSKSTTVESTSTEASASATPTPSAATTTPAATGSAVKNLAGVHMVLAMAIVGPAALLI